MKILVLNAGSSSLKYQLFTMTAEDGGVPVGDVLAQGLVERIGEESSSLKHKRIKDGKADTVTGELPVADHRVALELVIEALTEPGKGVISDTSEIEAVGHRVVHGGEHFTAPAIIDEKVDAAVEESIPLAPLQNPGSLIGMRVAKDLIPDAVQVDVFDTAFFQTIPQHAYLYAFPYEMYKELGVRRYGFHGTSHQYVSAEAAKLLGKPLSECNLITAHLGNGSSMSAIKNGKCIDTSMGMTPLAGLVMGTRTGDFDPAVLFYLAERKNMTIEEMSHLVHKESGLKGICGYSDLRDVHEQVEKGDERAKLALEMLCYRNKKYFGAYFAVLGRVDAIIFTAGIGENDAEVRRGSVTGLEHLGIKIDPEKNNGRFGEPTLVSADDSTVQIWVVPTNEELEIARQTFALAVGAGKKGN